MWYLYITASWRLRLRSYELLLTFSQFNLVFCAINVTDCMIYDIYVKAVFAPRTGVVRWTFPWCMYGAGMKADGWIWGKRTASEFPTKRSNPCPLLSKSLTSLSAKNLEWKTVWKTGRRVKFSIHVIGTAWHYRMSPGVWRVSALSATPQFTLLAHQASAHMLGNER